MPSSKRIDTGLLIVRIAMALAFIFHGAQLAFGAFGGPGIQGFAQFGHLPVPVAALVAYGEFLGGLGILFGVLTRLAGIAIAMIMLGAIFRVHLSHGYSVTDNGIEYPLTQLLLAITLIVTGPGRYTALALVGRGDAPATNRAPILQ